MFRYLVILGRVVQGNRIYFSLGGTCILFTVEPPLTTTSKEQPHAIKQPRTQVRIETTMIDFNVKQPLRNGHLSTPYNEQLSSPQSALAIENNFPERTATPRISRILLR